MHRICKVAAATSFLVWSFAKAQQNNVTSETVSTPDATGIVSVAGIPRVVRFNGKLNWTARSSATVPILFSLYQEREGGTPLWQEAQDVQVDSQGKFTVLLGATRKDGLPLDVFVNGKAHWLGIEMQPGQGQIEAQGQQPDDTEQRILLVGVPYALKAADADTLGGKPASAFLQAPVSPREKSSAKTSKTGATAASNDKENAANTPNAAVGGTGATNYIPLWLNSSTLGNSILYQNSGKIGIGTTAPVTTLEVTGASPAVTFEGYNTAATGSTFGVEGTANSTTGTGVYGKTLATSGPTIGVRGLANSTSGTGVFGYAPATSGATVGLLGQVSSANGVAAVLNNTNTAGGKLLSGRSGIGGGEVISIDSFGTITAQGNILLNGGSPNLSVLNNGSGDAITATTWDASAVHAYGGQSYSTAAFLGEGRQVSGLIANNDSSNNFNQPTIWGYSTSSKGSKQPVVYASGNGGSCTMDSDGNLTCTGTKSAAVQLPSGRDVALYAMESPENWFEDFGSAKLASGAATVKLDAGFDETVNSTSGYHVFLTPNGDCKGLFVSQKTPTSFEVRELGGGQSNVSFDYRIVAHRRGYEKLRLTDVTSRMKPVGTVPDLKNSNQPRIKGAKQTVPANK